MRDRNDRNEEAETVSIRDLRPGDGDALGRLMVEVYADLEGFPTREDQPDYYHMLANVGELADQTDTRILIASSAENQLLGGVVFFGDMKNYGSGGIAPTIRNASGIRLLVVDPMARRMGVGRSLTHACIQLAREKGHSEVILHTTGAMKVAWRLYEDIGFERSEDLDFCQEELPVFGFRMSL